MKKLIFVGIFILIIIMLSKIIEKQEDEYNHQVNEFKEILLKNGELIDGLIVNELITGNGSKEVRKRGMEYENGEYKYKFLIDNKEYFGNFYYSKYQQFKLELIRKGYFKIDDEVTILYLIENPQIHSLLAINGNRISDIEKLNSPNFHISEGGIYEGLPPDSLYYKKYFKEY